MNAPVMVQPPVPLSLRDAPSLIERVWPAQKISVETKREFDAHGAQTLTPLGSYWKGRKRLVYVRACVLAALLPATDDPVRDLEIFEKLMAIDDAAFLHRENRMRAAEVARLAIEADALDAEDVPALFAIPGRPKKGEPDPSAEEFAAALEAGKLAWGKGTPKEERDRLRIAAYGRLSYEDKVSRSLRPEELPSEAFSEIWDEVNEHLGTSARSHHELMDELGRRRFGHRPKVADPFCGAGSIPFEAARLGCDVYASDLNPIACMLTWGALHIIGGDQQARSRLEIAQKEVAEAVDRRIAALGIEHHEAGHRAKAYLYCVETRCPITGWMVPLLPSLVVSRIKRTVGVLVPVPERQRFEIKIITGASDAEMATAKLGTLQLNSLVYELDGETYRTPLATLRGDVRGRDRGLTPNNLRRWERSDVVPRPEDIFGERLYCVQWMHVDALERARPETFFATPTENDLEREKTVLRIVQKNLGDWQKAGYVPDMQIEPGEKTDEPIRTRGWTHWHHLFTPRQLLIGALVAEEIEAIIGEEAKAGLAFDRTFVAHNSARLSRWVPGTPGVAGRAPSADMVKGVFDNQALNTVFNFACRGFSGVEPGKTVSYGAEFLPGSSQISSHPARDIEHECDIFITDPPYADAVNYHEISEFFIAWLRKNPPKAFQDWTWDSRRPLAVKGSGDEFRAAMVDTFRAMAARMPANGLQIVMFTHQDAAVWADMAQIFWGAGLQVMAAWYVATETTSETKKGGYVQGTVTIVLRKRLHEEAGFKDEIVQEVKSEVAEQIDTMLGLNQSLKGHGRVENLFEDADLQMAGYAAALRVLTRYALIDGIDMAKEALRVRSKVERSLVGEIIDFAVQIANEHMVPEGMSAKVWERLTGAERFYYRMMDVETTGARKLDNYQNFAKAFRVADYGALMSSMEANKAHLKSAREFKKAGFEGGEFATSKSRALLYAIWEVEKEVDGDEVISHLRELVPGYFSVREEVMALADYVARKRATVDEAEARAARILHGLIRNEAL